MAAEGDSHSLERAAHAIKGASANIGADGLAAVCAEMEIQAGLSQLNGTAELVARFDSEFSRVRIALDSVVART
jgi:HPt (histidine-containing phosphotransfer) domain-containing protein